MSAEQRAQDILLVKRKSLLNDMANVIADKRKFDIFHEQDKQKNIILKIMINELQEKMTFICNA